MGARILELGAKSSKLGATKCSLRHPAGVHLSCYSNVQAGTTEKSHHVHLRSGQQVTETGIHTFTLTNRQELAADKIWTITCTTSDLLVEAHHLNGLIIAAQMRELLSQTKVIM